MNSPIFDVLVIGGGASGLMAAEIASASGKKVVLCDAKPSFGRKILMAGKSGLNISKSEEIDEFLGQYENLSPQLQAAILNFQPHQVQAWMKGLGQESFVGTSRRIYPNAMKASPLMRAWLQRLQQQNVQFCHHWRWIDGLTHPQFNTPKGQETISARNIVFALGGASWPRLGSDGAWVEKINLQQKELGPANMGFNCDWSEKMRTHSGQYIKNIRLIAGQKSAIGELTITDYGVESGLIYTLGTSIEKNGAFVDLLPHMTQAELAQKIQSKGKQSIGNFLRKLGLSAVERALFFECSHNRNFQDLKYLKLPILSPRPIDEAVSTRGGILFEALDAHFQSRAHKGVYFIGEMLDWSAPTGGYLLNACLAMGHHVGFHLSNS